LILANKIAILVLDEARELLAGAVGVDASLLEVASEELRCNCSKHNQHEHEENHDIEMIGSELRIVATSELMFGI
jgi:hypothetical protein